MASVDESSVAELVSCGFPPWVARLSLRAHKGDVALAMEECLAVQTEVNAFKEELMGMGFSEDDADGAVRAGKRLLGKHQLHSFSLRLPILSSSFVLVRLVADDDDDDDDDDDEAT